MISSSNTPFSAAFAASWCDRAANSSWSWRVISYLALCFSVEAPIATWSNAQNSPSYCMWSTSVVSPNLVPSRELLSMCGAWVIDS